jgi:hypothetical protein
LARGFLRDDFPVTSRVDDGEGLHVRIRYFLEDLASIDSTSVTGKAASENYLVLGESEFGPSSISYSSALGTLALLMAPCMNLELMPFLQLFMYKNLKLFNYSYAYFF